MLQHPMHRSRGAQIGPARHAGDILVRIVTCDAKMVGHAMIPPREDHIAIGCRCAVNIPFFDFLPSRDVSDHIQRPRHIEPPEGRTIRVAAA